MLISVTVTVNLKDTAISVLSQAEAELHTDAQEELRTDVSVFPPGEQRKLLSLKEILEILLCPIFQNTWDSINATINFPATAIRYSGKVHRNNKSFV